MDNCMPALRKKSNLADQLIEKSSTIPPMINSDRLITNLKSITLMDILDQFARESENKSIIEILRSIFGISEQNSKVSDQPKIDLWNCNNYKENQKFELNEEKNNKYRKNNYEFQNHQTRGNDNGYRSDKHDRNDRHDKYDKSDQYERRTKYDNQQRHDKNERYDRQYKNDRYENNDRYEKNNRHDKNDRHKKYDRQDNYDQFDQYDKYNKQNREDKYNKNDKNDKFKKYESYHKNDVQTKEKLDNQKGINFNQTNDINKDWIIKLPENSTKESIISGRTDSLTQEPFLSFATPE